MEQRKLSTSDPESGTQESDLIICLEVCVTELNLGLLTRVQ